MGNGARLSTEKKTVVIALGGNAILQPGQVGTFEEQLVNVDAAARRIARLVPAGWQVVMTHGNGPQVGNLLIQNEAASAQIPPMPMDVCGAESQGQIGYLFAQSLDNHLRRLRLDVPVCALLTQVEVSPSDPAFAAPSKPVGPFYSQARGKELALEKGVVMREDAGRGWRRVVPSPDPTRIVERDVIRDLVKDGVIVVCSGGGGVPVVRDKAGNLSGVEAVIDKDLAAAQLAADVEADVMLILTDVEKAFVDYGTPKQAPIDTVSVSEMARYQGEGHFKAGSMGPKIEACLRFARAGGTAIIANLLDVEPALRGETGTRIVPDAKLEPGSRAAR